MTLNGKVATPVKLICPKGCHGFISDEINIYLNQDSEVVIIGKCDECETIGALTLPIASLWKDCPIGRIN